MQDGVAGQAGERAISEVIGFVLLLGLLIAAIALYSLFVIPVTGREDEIAQLNYAEDQFTNYKFSLDALWSSQLTNSYSPVPALVVTPPTISMPMRLGTGTTGQQGGLSLWLFKPVPSSATMRIRSTGDRFDIDSSSYHAWHDTDGEFPLDVTALEYDSNNNYWIQQQYSYALGGVSLSQDDGSINRISPLISVTRSTNHSLVVNVVPVQITATNRSYTTNGPVRVDTTQWVRPAYNISRDGYRINQWVNLSYSSADNATAVMWHAIFREMVAREHFDSTSYKSGSAYDPVAKRTTAYLYLSQEGMDPQVNTVTLLVHRADFNVTFNTVVSEIT